MSTGEITLIPPTIDITPTGQTITVGGVEIEFQLAPGTEAPAEMHYYFPATARCAWQKTPATHPAQPADAARALVRDPRIWAHYLTEAIELFSDRADVEFGSHHWPTWDRDEIVDFLTTQRDLYAYRIFRACRDVPDQQCLRPAHGWSLHDSLHILLRTFGRSSRPNH